MLHFKIMLCASVLFTRKLWIEDIFIDKRRFPPEIVWHDENDYIFSPES